MKVPIENYAKIEKLYYKGEDAYVRVKFVVTLNDEFVGMFQSYCDAEHYICEVLLEGDIR